MVSAIQRTISWDRNLLGLAFRKSLLTFGEKSISKDRDGQKARLQLIKIRKLKPIEHSLDWVERKGEGRVGKITRKGCKRVSSYIGRRLAPRKKRKPAGERGVMIGQELK